VVLTGYVGGGAGLVRGAVIGDVGIVAGGVGAGDVIGGVVVVGGGIGAVIGDVGRYDEDLVPKDVILMSCATVLSLFGNVMVTAACVRCAVTVFSTLYAIVTMHPERSARSFFVKMRDELVPFADVIMASTVSGLSITDIRQFDTDSVAENLVAFVDDHLSVNVDAVAVVDDALFTVRLAVGKVRAAVASRAAVDDAMIGGGCGVVVASSAGGNTAGGGGAGISTGGGGEKKPSS